MRPNLILMTETAAGIWGFRQELEVGSLSVMAGLVPAIHVLPAARRQERGCPAQGRA
jgi:hypothetical protein